MGLIICPDCGHNISSEAPACPYCGKPMFQPPLIRPRSPHTIRRNRLIGLGVLAVIVVGFIWAYQSDEKSNAAYSNRIKAGDTVRFIGGSTTAFAATDLDTLKKLETSISAKDKTGFGELYATGKIIDLPVGTEALVLDLAGAGGVQVRLRSGANSGRAVWTDLAWVQKK